MSNPTEAWLLQPGGLAKELKRLREATGMSGSAFAEKLGWHQTKISRIETGGRLPKEEDVRAWALAANVNESATQELLDLRAQAEVVSRAWKRGQVGGQDEIQQNYDELLHNATVVRNAEVTTIPGLLQTPEYMRAQFAQAVSLHGFPADGVEPAIDVRIKRQQVLYNPTTRFEFVITEAALRLQYCPTDAMLAQLDRLLAATFMRPNFWFGIIPFAVELPVVPQNRFLVVDDLVLVEHFAGDETYRGDRAETYGQAMDALMAEAVTGQRARDLIVLAMAVLRPSAG